MRGTHELPQLSVPLSVRGGTTKPHGVFAPFTFKPWNRRPC